MQHSGASDILDTLQKGGAHRGLTPVTPALVGHGKQANLKFEASLCHTEESHFEKSLYVCVCESMHTHTIPHLRGAETRSPSITDISGHLGEGATKKGCSRTSQAAFQHVRAVLEYSPLQGFLFGPKPTSYPAFLPVHTAHSRGPTFTRSSYCLLMLSRHCVSLRLV